MTLPASGQIAAHNINEEAVLPSTAQLAMSWVKDNTKGNPNNYDSLHGKTYYQRNMDGNCDSAPNPAVTNCNCTGNIQCANCIQVALTNCRNCDTKKYYQANCNCDPVYNCTTSKSRVYNCNCNCNCFWSDDRLKNRKSDITGALDIVKSLTGFIFEGNAEAERLGLDTSLSAGVSAQDIEKHYPVGLSNIKIDGKYNIVDYYKLIPLLIEAIKELDDKNNKK